MKGSIAKKVLPGGQVRWVLRYDRPGGDGGRRQAQETHRTKAEAEAALARALGGPPTNPGRATFGDLLGWYLDGREGVVTAGSLANYRVAAKRVPAWARAIRLRDLGPAQVQRLRTELAATHAPGTARQTWQVVKAALGLGVDWDLLAKDPSRRVAPPAPPEGEAGRALSAAECRRLVAELDADPRLPGLWALLLVGGLRIGEALALRWEDVDPALGVVLVRRTISRTKTGAEVVRERTKTGQRRTVALDAATVAALERQRAGQPAGCAWVCADAAGGRVGYKAALRRLAALADAAGVGPVTPHDLRRTMATGFGRLRAPAKLTADRLGHSSTAMTAKYDRPALNEQRAVAEEWARTVRGED